MKRPKFSRVWAVVRDNKLIRLTFSRLVAELCASYDSQSEVCRLRVRRGRQLEPGEQSETGVYLLCTAKCGTPLRAQLDSRVSALLYDPNHRHIYVGQLDR